MIRYFVHAECKPDYAPKTYNFSGIIEVPEDEDLDFNQVRADIVELTGDDPKIKMKTDPSDWIVKTISKV